MNSPVLGIYFDFDQMNYEIILWGLLWPSLAIELEKIYMRETFSGFHTLYHQTDDVLICVMI